MRWSAWCVGVKGASMYQCKSGRHWWLREADSAKCCNGYVRVLVLQEVGQPLPGDVVNVASEGEVLYGRRWVKADSSQSS